MPPTLRHLRPRRLLAFAVIAALLLPPARAGAAADAGTVEGRVLNVLTGAYLENARVSVEGATLAAFTNNVGEYRLAGVPAGPATVRVFFTGLEPQIATVAVVAGEVATRDFSLTQMDVVKLDAFVVAGAKEATASALAINEQRFSANIKNVVAADEFGTVTEGNVAEFLKFLPGVTLDYVAADARSAQVRGMPSAGTAVMVDGNRVANSGSGVPGRAFEFDQLSINNVSRIEVTKGPTPDSPADAIGGTVNMVSKSAFERTRAEFTYRVYMNLNHQWQQDQNFISFQKTPGHGREPTVKIKPGFDFTYVNPVSKTFGFTLTGLYSNIFNQQFTSAPTWSPTSNGGAGGTLAEPAMTTYRFNQSPKSTVRYSIGATADYRVARRDVLSVRGSFNAFDAFFNDHAMTMTAGTPASYGPTFTQGSNGSITQVGSTRKAARATYLANAKWRHDGPVWKWDTSVNTSRSKGLFRDIEYGWFKQVSLSQPGLRIRFDGINETRPDTVTATNQAGGPVDIRELGGYNMTLTNTNPVNQFNRNMGATANVSRYFDLGVPVLVKAGADLRRTRIDARRPFQQWSFVGPDRLANNADNRVGLYDLVDESGSSVPAPYGNGPWQYASPWKAWDLYGAHPEYFIYDEVFAIQQSAQNSRIIREDVLSHYLRFDVRLLQNKLWIVAGARYEQTRNEGDGPINDISRTYQRNAAGQLIDGNPNAAGIQPVRVPGTTVEWARLQYVDRGAHVSNRYGDLYPSVNLSYEITPNLIARASYADTLARPNYGSILPGVTLPDPSGTSRTITLNNVNLEPWTAKNYDVALSYYPRAGGEVSAGAFRKDIKDFFGGTTVDVTPELLEEYGIDSSYAAGGYVLSTQENVGAARITGMEFNYRQPLKFLPHWARGVSVRYNLTRLHLEGNRLADFSTFVSRSENWGISLDRPKFNLRLNWNARGRQRQAAIAGRAEPGTYNYVAPRLTMDIDAEYRFSRAVGLFLGARNITGEPFVEERYGPSTPGYARRFVRTDYGIAISMGMKGAF
ncbi:MAG: TonB-dependent receptor [Opitutaceae bacterium]|nr:TonB-dependent receptor [Opitutaceae bacterium]